MAEPKTPPKTCREAADRFKDWADNCPYLQRQTEYRAYAEVLRAFGDEPVPRKFLDLWDWTR